MAVRAEMWTADGDTAQAATAAAGEAPPPHSLSLNLYQAVPFWQLLARAPRPRRGPA